MKLISKLQIVNNANHIPTVSIHEAIQILSELTQLHAQAAASLEPSTNAYSSNTWTAKNALEAQVRLLHGIERRIVGGMRFNETNPGGGPSSDISATNLSSFSYPQVAAKDYLSSSECQPTVPLGLEPAGPSSFQFSSVLDFSTEDQEIKKMAEEMDFTLDIGYLDAEFSAAGLTPWNLPGIYVGFR